MDTANKLQGLNGTIVTGCLEIAKEPIRCDECVQGFGTIESLKEHRETERQEKELRNKGIDD